MMQFFSVRGLLDRMEQMYARPQWCESSKTLKYHCIDAPPDTLKWYAQTEFDDNYKGSCRLYVHGGHFCGLASIVVNGLRSSISDSDDPSERGARTLSEGTSGLLMRPESEATLAIP